ncbi:MAG: hypothetical protein S4CHLAM7_03110 [Chlamydiae bacterium]|nr:hypothetical protein [Chlamydiota bacterium]
MQVLYIILGALGLGLLVFIHELAHFWMARRVGMHVEAFSIGFGKAILSWKRNGVQWRIGILPFGGYVKIAGMQKEKGVEPHEIPGGYFSKKPIDRIKVAGIAPLVNLVVAFLLFTTIWLLGGREKPFHDYTHRIGWVEPKSEAYAQGISPGDQITYYNNRKFHNFKELFQGTMLSNGALNVKGYSFDYLEGTKKPFNVDITPYQHPDFIEKGILTSGILSPANYILYNKLPNGQDNPLSEGTPLYNSGLAYGDRLIWMDGELLFSNLQLNELLNTQYSLITVNRDGKNLLAKISKAPTNELKLNAAYKEELGDLKYEGRLKPKLRDLLILPYQVSSNLVVEAPLVFFEDSSVSPGLPSSSTLVETSLKPGDRILAVNGEAVSEPIDLLNALQSHKFNIIVQTGQQDLKLVPFQVANANFEKQINWQQLKQLMNSIGTSESQSQLGSLKLLNPIVPLPLTKLAEASNNAYLLKSLDAQQQKIDEITNSERKEQAQAAFTRAKSRLYLGASFQDREVLFNPPPYVLFGHVTADVFHTLKALVSGSLNPKWLSGPIGIVQVMQQGWSIGLKEALYWLALISLNLGMLNLMPIPALDGGHICFAAWEICTKKRLKSKTMERIVLPFVILLIGLFIFVTFHDLSRLIKGIL